MRFIIVILIDFSFDFDGQEKFSMILSSYYLYTIFMRKIGQFVFSLYSDFVYYLYLFTLKKLHKYTQPLLPILSTQALLDFSRNIFQ